MVMLRVGTKIIRWFGLPLSVPLKTNKSVLVLLINKTRLNFVTELFDYFSAVK